MEAPRSRYGLGLDLETNGLDTDNCRIFEVGIVQVRLDDWAMGSSNGWIILQDSTLMTDEVRSVSHIDLDLMNVTGLSEFAVLKRLNQILYSDQIECVIAWNGRKFDKLVYENACKRLDLPVIEKVWIDPMQDIEWPPHIHGRKLVHVAAEHGFVNVAAHRAVFDVATMLKICSNYSYDDMLFQATAPEITIAASIPYDRKEEVKKLGYRWNSERKIWYKTFKDVRDNFEIEKKVAIDNSFKIEVVDAP